MLRISALPKRATAERRIADTATAHTLLARQVRNQDLECGDSSALWIPFVPFGGFHVRSLSGRQPKKKATTSRSTPKCVHGAQTLILSSTKNSCVPAASAHGAVPASLRFRLSVRNIGVSFASFVGGRFGQWANVQTHTRTFSATTMGLGSPRRLRNRRLKHRVRKYPTPQAHLTCLRCRPALNVRFTDASFCESSQGSLCSCTKEAYDGPPRPSIPGASDNQFASATIYVR